ncbi:hypothetical protein [Vibrio cholerae]|uniref:hypothetical protein n=1 Tax=Vibrio cholerae TaxID=666 RepID=UPI000E0B4826|nr:hypothetical protein [Vibrio cholerae]
MTRGIMTVNTTISDFIALVEREYPHVKPRRDNEHAPLEDFINRHLQGKNPPEIDDLIIEVLNKLQPDPWRFNDFFWLVEQISPDFRYKTEEVIYSGKVKANVNALKNYAKHR